MPKFSADTVEPLDYDFTGITPDGGKTYCKGKGTIPEPSQARLEGFSKAIRELYEVSADATAKEIEKKMDRAEAEKDAKEKQDQLLELTAEFCQNSPTKEELEGLPPRVQRLFFKHIFRELTDPEV